MKKVDVVVIGAGAAGMMCAAVAARRGRSVVLIDHADKLAEKIRISGGGRCNFTNVNAGPANYVSENPHFCRSALARYTPQDFMKLIESYGICWHEKHKGQLFCNESSQQIIDLLESECRRYNVQWKMPLSVLSVQPSGEEWLIETPQATWQATSVVIATGGMAIPKIGATDFGLKIARQLQLKVIEPRPALVPLTFSGDDWAPFVSLAGLSLEVTIEAESGVQFKEDLLFTHRGMSGPAILQISSFWNPGETLTINLLPELDLAAFLIEQKNGSRQLLSTVMAACLPKRLADFWIARMGLEQRSLAEVSDKQLRAFATALQSWVVVPNGTEGFKKAEAMRGGVDTKGLDSKTMMVKSRPGLYFIGEVVDVTGWLGGYNFQWAWASAQAAGQAV